MPRMRPPVALCGYPQRMTGHVDRKMLEHYSHIRMEAKRKALEALSSTASPLENEHSEPQNGPTAEDSYVTNHVTNATLEKSNNS